MALTTGTLVNHYKVTSLLGVGGMGEVYKAHDTRLDRPVALKILPARLVEDEDRVRRFIQEAKSASALNHPHIVTIYEIGQVSSDVTGGEGDAGGTNRAGLMHYIAMEFVEGATLHSKIHREKLDLKKSLGYLAQVADGLAKAHTVGIVHRDLKPENIMITDDGYSKILDFGLAKLVEPTKEEPAASGEEMEEAATAMMSHTRPGMVMGTVGYMSPEQVEGKKVDQRSDIFSFGCILYEAATGAKPFSGDSLIDSLHKIAYAQAPSIRDLNPNAPGELQRIVRKCLAKNPDERYQSVKDVAIDLRDLVREYDTLSPYSGSYPQTAASGPHQQQSFASDSYPPAEMTRAQQSVTGAHTQTLATGAQQSLSSETGGATSPTPARKKARWAIYAAGLVALAVAGLALLYFFIGQKQAKNSPITAFQKPNISKLTSSGKSVAAVISPDGRFVAHIVNEEGLLSLWLKQVATSSNERKIPPADIIYRGVAFSRDSNYIYYTTSPKGAPVATLYQIPVFGGEPKKVLEDVDSSVTFSPDGKRFAFIRGFPRERESGLMVVNADGTGEQKLVVIKGPDAFVEAEWSPDGKVIACCVRSLAGGFHMELTGIQVADGAMTPIGSQRWGVIAGLSWLSDSGGMVVSAADQRPGANQIQLWQVSYPAGERRRITNDLNNYAGVSLTADSTQLVTAQADTILNVWAVPPGDTARARQITSGSSKNAFLSASPDGRIVYVSDAGGHLDIWIMDGDGKNQKQLTNDDVADLWPSVSPDGRYIVFGSNRATKTTSYNIWRIDMDGSNARQLTSGQGEYWPIVSADSKWVIYTPIGEQEKFTLWKVPIEGGEPMRITDKASLQAGASPDGKMLAVWQFNEQQSTLPRLALLQAESGQMVKQLDVPPPPSIGEFKTFQWTPDGKAITYVDARGGTANLWAKPLDGGPARQLTSFTSDQIFTFDWMRDGKQLICVRGFSQTDVILIRDEERLDVKK